ncbi:LysR substrate-binding domain-containing protein [Streptomyces aureocirculatus]|uniref:LysR substrate-binding domain-containing protein n=1 Tax=Streptomyces aureocirculatus TaxID=67275 RepID=UPI00068B44AC|nr:LysR substrate-binding domain-containing protein [Streptomyces aureocirculatus]
MRAGPRQGDPHQDHRHAAHHPGTDPLPEEISVRYVATAGARLAAPALARLRREHPGVQAELRLTDPATRCLGWEASCRAPCLDAVLDACGAAGFTPDFVMDSGDYATAQGFVAAGVGVALVPATGLMPQAATASVLPHPGLAVRAVRDPVPVRSIWAAVRATAPRNPVLQAFLEALREAATTARTSE